ncbi:MAG: SIS domain-containing protein [Sandaracinaceae bacterium]
MADPLAQLYPDLTGGAATAVSDEELRSSVRAKASESAAAQRAFFAAREAELVAAARMLADVFRAGGRLLTMGNGGSSCDAAHLAVEFNHPITVGRPALPAIHLGADVPMLTAVGNDVGFGAVFVRQVISHGRQGDALFGFSTSGTSANLLAAFEAAKGRGLLTLGLAGGDGGRMATSPFVDLCLVVPTASVHRVQESHLLAYHILWDLVHTLLHAHPGEAGP